MFKIVKKISFIAAIVCSAATAEAQQLYTNAQGQVYQLDPVGSSVPGALSTNSNPATIIFNYFTGFNSNLTTCFAPTVDYQAWVGASYQNNIFLGGCIGEEIQPFSGLHGLTFRAVETLAPTVGTLAGAELDAGWSMVYVDTRTTLFIGGDLQNKDGAQNQPESVCFDYGAEFEKAVAKNAFGGVFAEGKTRTKGAFMFGFITGFSWGNNKANLL